VAVLGVLSGGVALGGLKGKRPAPGGSKVETKATPETGTKLGMKTGTTCGCGCGCWWCPDDYRAKPCPCVCLPPLCGGCDDYCPKPAPCVCVPPICGGCDDYRAKCPPCVRVCPWPNAFYRCVPTAECYCPRGPTPVRVSPMAERRDDPGYR